MPRILYLINHVTLLESECVLLENLGFELFLSKEHKDIHFSSMTYKFDKTLTISKEDLAKLNRTNFYTDEITPELSKIINKNFDMIIVPNLYPLAFKMAEIDQNLFMIRAFGYEGDKTYESMTIQSPEFSGIRKLFKPKILRYYNKMTKCLYQMGKRFYLGVSYEKIIDNETPFFKKHSVYLPIGIPQAIWQKQNMWNGKEKRVAFVCSLIDNPYYEKVYKTFKQNFSDISHIILGKQSGKYKDKQVTGYLPREEYDKYLIDNAVLFYHSQEKRHLHYHPLEAIIMGVPVIYMDGGELEDLGGTEQPGLCHSFEEAREKIKRILSDDYEFIQEIKTRQTQILHNFKDDYVKQILKQNFLPLFKNKIGD